MILRRLLFLVLILGVAAFGAPVSAATPAHHLPPVDCGSSGSDKSAPACIHICLSRPLCPQGPAVVEAPVPAAAKANGLRPVDDRLPGRSIGPEPPPPRI